MLPLYLYAILARISEDLFKSLFVIKRKGEGPFTGSILAGFHEHHKK
jgi:hypothetical protein